MRIKIKKYQKNNVKDFDRCMIQLQDFLVKIDPLQRLRRAANYSPQYANNVINKVVKYDGVLFLAYDHQKIVGCIAAIIEKQSKKNLLELPPTKAGRILELFVWDEYRNLGLGKKLMAKAENYLRQKRCDVIRVEVFAPNKAAHNFYRQLNYQNRLIDMIKPLK